MLVAYDVALSVAIGDVGFHGAVAVFATVGIDHSVVGEGNGIGILTQILAPGISVAALVDEEAELASGQCLLCHHRGSIVVVEHVVGEVAVDAVVDVTGQQRGVAGEYHLAGSYVAVLNLGLHRSMGIADDGCAALAVGSSH